MEHSEHTERLWELIKAINVAMMVTEVEGQLRSRPMAGTQTSFDGILWFFTHAHSHKVSESVGGDRVNLSYAHPGKQDYVSVSGHAELVRDRSAIEQHWSEAMRVWFPGGKDDPNIAMLKVTVEYAEYWDAPSSAMLHAYGYVKALVTGEPPRPGGHGRIHA